MKVRLARRYAQALFRLADTLQSIRETEGELLLVEQVFAQTEIAAFMSNPGVSASVKKETIVRVFGTEVSSVVQNFLCHLADKRRTDVLSEIIKAYRVLVRQASNILDVEVVTATVLADQDKLELAAQLAGITGKAIELHERVDLRIIGGLIIQIGDRRIDNSVAARLVTMKDQMLQQIVGGK